MYMRSVDASQLRRTLFAMLDVVEQGEDVAVVRKGKTVAVLKAPATAAPVVDDKQIAKFCRKHKIREFALFGSILRDDFGPSSDVDVMIDQEGRGSFGELMEMTEELEKLFGRPVDLLTKDVVQQHQSRHRRESILGSAKVIYAA